MKKFISNFHNPLIEALKNFKGEEFTTREIKKLILKKFPELKDKNIIIKNTNYQYKYDEYMKTLEFFLNFISDGKIIVKIIL